MGGAAESVQPRAARSEVWRPLAAVALSLGAYLMGRQFAEGAANAGTSKAMVLGGLAVYLFLVGVAYVLARRLAPAALAASVARVSRRSQAVLLLVGAATGSVVVLGTAMLLLAVGWAHLAASAHVSARLVTSAAGVSFLIFAVIAVNEEVVFRRLLPALLRPALGSASVVAAALVFVGVHWSGWGRAPLYALDLFLFALLASMLVRLAGTLWIAIGLHLTWNFVSFLLFLGEGPQPKLVVTGVPWLAGVPDHLSAGLAMTGVLAVMLAGAMAWSRAADGWDRAARGKHRS